VLLTRSGEYALQALIYIADHGDGPVRTAEIAQAVDVPRNYLSKLLHQLARAGVLRSERGPRGGFALNEPAATLCLKRLLEPIEADRIESRCLLGRPRCTDADPCPAHAEWKGLREHITSFLENTTLADLRREGMAGRR
jgi:Rrf2 family protein